MVKVSSKDKKNIIMHKQKYLVESTI